MANCLRAFIDSLYFHAIRWYTYCNIEVEVVDDIVTCMSTLVSRRCATMLSFCDRLPLPLPGYILDFSYPTPYISTTMKMMQIFSFQILESLFTISSFYHIMQCPYGADNNVCYEYIQILYKKSAVNYNFILFKNNSSKRYIKKVIVSCWAQLIWPTRCQ